MRRTLLLTAMVALPLWSCSSNDAASQLGAFSEPSTSSGSTGGAGGAAGPGASSAVATVGTGSTSTVGSSAATGGASSTTQIGSGGSAAGGANASGGAAGGVVLSDAGGDGPSVARADASDESTRAGDGGLSCAGTVFCEDFEKQTLGSKPAGMFKVNVSGGGSMTVDATKAYSGKQSALIKIQNPVADASARMVFDMGLLPLASNDLHGRAMVWVTALPYTGQDQNVHWDLTTARGAGGIQYTLGSMFGNFMAVYQPGDCSVDTKTQFPVGRWACVQWEFKGAADGTHLLRMALDGMLTNPGEVTTMGPPNCVQGANREWKATTWTQMDFGWVNFQAAHIPIEMWIDDLAFGEQPIDCPSAPAP